MIDITNIKIESGIEIPSKMHKSGLTSVLRRMNVGESFLIEAHHAAESVHSCARHVKGIKVSTRKVDVDGKIMIRIWRIK